MAKSKGRGKSKGKKGKKKEKKNVRKFKLDLFGLLTLTRVHGEPFEAFMYSGAKGGKKDKKAKKQPNKKGKKGKGKKGKQEQAPDLTKFKELPPLPIVRIKGKENKELEFAKDPILPYVNTGYQKQQRTTRRDAPLQRAGSIRDVLCGPKWPLPPRPQPHGGVFGDPKCPGCKMEDHLLKTEFGLAPKKLRKMLTNHFEKAKYVLEYLTNHARKGIDFYRAHIQAMIDLIGPAMDDLDASEFEDHFQVRDLVDKWKKLQKELLKIKKEYRHLRDNQDAEIERLLAEKQAEVDAAEKRLRDLEEQLEDAADTLADWRENGENKLKGPQEEIERLLALLAAVKNSVYVERDFLRDLLAWETKVASETTVKEMERIITEDIKRVLKWMHTAWFYLVAENKKLEDEEKVLSAENHLLELEVETLQRQINQLSSQKKKMELATTHSFRPPTITGTIDRYFKERGKLQLYEYPTTELLHE